MAIGRHFIFRRDYAAALCGLIIVGIKNPHDDDGFFGFFKDGGGIVVGGIRRGNRRCKGEKSPIEFSPLNSSPHYIAELIFCVNRQTAGKITAMLNSGKC